MADSEKPLNQLKPLDRFKPFKRIHNDAFLPPSAPPDGNGVACGCRLPEDFTNLEDDFKKFLEDPNNTHLLGNLLQVLNEARAVAHAVVTALQAIAPIAAAAAALLGGGSGLLGGPITAVLAAIATITAAAATFTAFIDRVLKLLDDGVREFFARIGATLARRAIRRIPQWVPVLQGASSQTITKDQIKEVEGIVVRSFGDPIETPFFQWHEWLNWSFQVQPEEAYKNLMPDGFELNKVNRQPGETPIVAKGTFEVQWDAGALLAGDDGFGPYAAGFDENQMPDNDGAMVSGDARESDWIWPMAGMYAWASGRWVYDCARTDKLTGKDQKMMAMMNPPRAMATARWEARNFPENLPGSGVGETRVPAIRFMFLASKHGGYMSYDSNGDDDYEFILDLPPVDVPTSPFPIGHTFTHKRDPGEAPDFPHNTILIRPRLLRELVRLEAPVAVGLIKPVIEILPPVSDKPGAAPQQVKLTIRASDIQGVKGGFAGFILSLGWLDPNLEQAATVKNCNVAFSALDGRFVIRDSPLDQIRPLFQRDLEAVKDKLKKDADDFTILPIPGAASINQLINNNLPKPIPHDQVHNLGLDIQKIVDDAIDKAFELVLEELAKLIAGSQTEEWLVRIGVNGRWQTRYLPKVDKGVTQVFKEPCIFNIPLGPEDFLFYSSGGVEFNPVGDMMRARRSDRLLNKGGDPTRPFTWNEIVNAQGAELRSLVFDYALKILTGNSSTGLLALGIENTILGIKDPKSFAKAANDNDPEIDNPISMKGVKTGSTQIQPVVKFARAALPKPDNTNPPEGTGEEFILVEDPSKSDYKLTGLIQIFDQKTQ